MKYILFIITICVSCALSVAQPSVGDTVINVSCTDSITNVAENDVVIAESSSNYKITEHSYRSEDYAFDGWYNIRSTFVSCLTIIASIVTIIGILSILGSIRRNMISRSCQRRIIIDLIRHFIVNAAIVDGVKYKLNKGERPEEGVFNRLATLDADMNLERFELNSQNYEAIHNLSLSMRNYNLYVTMVEEHFKYNCNKENKKDLYRELETINKRISDIVSKLWKLQISIGHKISIGEIVNYVISKYENKVETDEKCTNVDGLDKIQIPLEQQLQDESNTEINIKYVAFYKKYVFHKMGSLAFKKI